MMMKLTRGHKYTIIFYVLFFIIQSTSLAAKYPSVCLNMIVKDEAEVITRCLASVLPLIDYWVISDTGSTDDTKKIIQDFMAAHGIPGQLLESEWVDFGHNRNEALQAARGKADYLLFMDADEYLSYESGFQLPFLDKDFYYFTISHSGTEYPRIQLVKNKHDWKYEGVLHEVLIPPSNASFQWMEGLKNIYTTEGARSKDPEKYKKDAAVFEKELEKNPDNTRTIFYLAQSYKDAGNYPKAIEFYRMRVDKSASRDEEAFWSLFQIAALEDHLKMPAEQVVASYLKAFLYRPTRAEPLYYLAQYFRTLEDFHSAYLIADIAKSISTPRDLLFVQKWIYDYGVLLELSVSAYWTGKFDETRLISENLLKKDSLPDNIRSCVEANLRFANGKLCEKICEEALMKKL